ERDRLPGCHISIDRRYRYGAGRSWNRPPTFRSGLAALVTMIADLGIAFGRVAFVMLFVLNLGGLLTWVERKQSAIMQDRIGANRASIRVPFLGIRLRLLGLLHPLADAIKMLTKEDFRPARADRFLFGFAPFVSVFFALVAFASIPFGDVLRAAGREIPLQAV